MPKVLVLPDHIASQIAAGEVVERPSSVVKELVENSIDAGATQIEVVIGSDCRDIRIADNGCGMDAEDAVLAFHRHATSKISSADDLWNIKTMGFRGEALPTISSVAKVTCLTRSKDATSGIKLEAADGKVESSEAGCAFGTVMEVQDLFYNVPARLKFLKRPSTEYGHIYETVQTLALANPKIAFQLIYDGEVTLRTTGSGKLAQAIKEAKFAKENEELYPVTYVDLKSGTAVYGYIARPLYFRGDRKGILSTVNGRPVRCPVTYKVLDYAYSDLIPKGKFPVAVLTITIQPQAVDVNVHPTKKEIKYSNSNEIYPIIQKAINETLRNINETSLNKEEETAGSIPPNNNMAVSSQRANTQYESYAQVQEIAEPRATYFQSRSTISTLAGKAPEVQQNSSNSQQITFSEQLSTRHVSTLPESRPSLTVDRKLYSLPDGHTLLGYLHNTYILIQTPEGLEVIEQHIAHERTLYERFLAEQKTAGRISENSQKLVLSSPLNLSAEQRSILSENLERMQALGFDFDLTGNSDAFCTQIPLELVSKDYVSIIQAMLEDMAEASAAELDLTPTKSLACQAAIKNGMPLSQTDIVQLIHQWNDTPRKDTCPHGRPVKLKFSMQKLFDLFHP